MARQRSPSRSGGAMRRRTFLAWFGASIATFADGLHAEEKRQIISFVGLTTAAEWAPYVQGFRAGLKDAGLSEGQDVVVDYKWVEGRYERLSAIMADLVKRRVDVIVPV